MENSKVSKYAMMLAAAEIGFGSIFHNFHIPMSGQLLSLNQVYLLSVAKTDKRCSPILISFFAALFKISLGNGKKITPAIAISMQGVLFELGSLVSLYFGAILLSLWSYIQPMMIFFLMSSGNIDELYSFYLQKFSGMTSMTWLAEKLYYLIIFGILLKITFAILLVKLAKQTKIGMFHKYQNLINKPVKAMVLRKHETIRITDIFKDLFRPFYLISMITILFFKINIAQGVYRMVISIAQVMFNTLIIISLSHLTGLIALKYTKKNSKFKTSMEALFEVKNLRSESK